MDAFKFLILLLVIPLLPATAVGEEALPRVLILGDSIYQQPAGEAAKMLKGKVEVIYVPMKPGEVRNTAAALEDLDRLLGEKKWHPETGNQVNSTGCYLRFKWWRTLTLHASVRSWFANCFLE